MPDFVISRRTFLAAVAASGLQLSPIAQAVAAAVEDYGQYKWCACVINCGQRCPVRCFTKNGQVIRIETDNTANPEADASATSCRQLRACQRGRSMRERIYSPDRLKFPMKRVGRRGEGKFERISWEEAVQTIAAQLGRRIKETYGNESHLLAVLLGPAVACELAPRLAAPSSTSCGGCLKYYGSYSDCCSMPGLLPASPTADVRRRLPSSKIADARSSTWPSATTPAVDASPRAAARRWQVDGAPVQRHRPRTIVIDPMLHRHRRRPRRSSGSRSVRAPTPRS